jgi:hypothetical protein
MITPHNFAIGDNITVTDKHSSVGVYRYPCRILRIEGDYYVIKRRRFDAVEERIGKYYPHIEKD